MTETRALTAPSVVHSGEVCELCSVVAATPNPDWGLPVYTGRVATGYLRNQGQIRGFCVLVWHGGHAGALNGLDEWHVQEFSTDLFALQAAIADVLDPADIDTTLTGNTKHLHAMLVPRTRIGDPAPGRLLPPTYLTHGVPAPTVFEQLAAELCGAFEESAG